MGGRGSVGHRLGEGGQRLLPSKSLWRLGAQVLGLHKQQQARAQPGELSFQLTNLFPWQEATFPCIFFFKKKERVRESAQGRELFSFLASTLEPGRRP